MDSFGWLEIVRLGLVQAALGAIVVLTTSTINRVMVVELALPAVVPGALVTLHHAMQLLRPRMGYGGDGAQRRTPWIVGGMMSLAAGGFGAAAATAWFPSAPVAAMALAILAFALVGAGVSAAGTSLLVLLAKRVPAGRRGAAATIVWMMMIAGFAVTAGVAGRKLEPFSGARLMQVAGVVSLTAVLVTALAMFGLEGRSTTTEAATVERARTPFRRAIAEVWEEPDARRFTAFVFIAMLSYSAQDLILEPFAGAHFAFSPGESTKLSGVQHGGVFVGMLLVAVVTTLWKGTRLASLKAWTVAGCGASGVTMFGLVLAGISGGHWPLRGNVFLLGIANGVFSIAAIGSMMTLASQGRAAREGTKMGLWGAAQAIAFGAGGFLGTVVVELARPWLAPAHAYATVFALEALGFFAAQGIAATISFGARDVAMVTQASAVHDG
jgi:BCD family chlorophyll transporter-like MFS transporter